MRSLAILLMLTVAASAQVLDRVPNIHMPAPRQTMVGTIPAWCCTPNQVKVLVEIRNMLNDQPEITDAIAAMDLLSQNAAAGDKDSYVKWTAHFKAEVTRLGIAGQTETIRNVVRGIAHAHCRPTINPDNTITYACRMLI